jgi:uncharacterized protein YndB with AHSA1/START domain
VLKWILYVVLGLGGLVGLVALVGFTLPKGHRASKTTTYAAAPAAVFDVIADVVRYAEWRLDLQRVELLPDEGGMRMFRENGKQGAITYRVEVLTPPTRMVVRIADRSLAFGGTWTHELRPTPSGGTELTTTEDGEVYNPIFRVMSKFFFSPTATIEAYHAALLKRLG